MSKPSSPILIFGDSYLSKNNIILAKKKYPDATWVTLSAANDSLDSIRMEIGSACWNDSQKFVVIQDIPNRKQVRDFLLDIASSTPSFTTLLIWDSNNHIKVDPKTKTFDKTWATFLKDFRGIQGHKIVNNGMVLTEKEQDNSLAFVKNCFDKRKKHIETGEAKLLISIVGYDRGMLDSDIEKMCLTCPDKVTAKFILDNTFPSSKDAIIYKLSNVLDTASYEDSVNITERFFESGVNENVLAETFLRKARWQMVVAYYWYIGINWNDMPERLMQMGKFPSWIWHNPNIDFSGKKRESDDIKDPEDMLKFLVRKQGVPRKYFKILSAPQIESEEAEAESKTKIKSKSKTKAKKKRAETVPMLFMASQTVDFVKNKVVGGSERPDDIKKKVLNRALEVYLFVQEKLASIRYGQDPSQDLQEIIRVMTNVRLDYF